MDNLRGVRIPIDVKHRSTPSLGAHLPLLSSVSVDRDRVSPTLCGPSVLPPRVRIRNPVLDPVCLGIGLSDRSHMRTIDLDIAKQVAYANDTVQSPSLYVNARG